VSVAHLALVPEARLEGERPGARFWAIDDLAEGYGPPLDLDHSRIIDDAVERTRAKLEYTTLATRFVREPFTISDLYDVYRAVWGADPGDKANFARKVKRTEGFVIPTGTTGPRSGRGRPSMRFIAGAAAYLHPPILRPAASG
jgi:8-oxo-dGTP diphosphatase